MAAFEPGSRPARDYEALADKVFRELAQPVATGFTITGLLDDASHSLVPAAAIGASSFWVSRRRCFARPMRRARHAARCRRASCR